MRGAEQRWPHGLPHSGARFRGWRSLERELTVELNAAVVKVRGRVAPPTANPEGSAVHALERALRHVGAYATEQQMGLLIHHRASSHPQPSRSPVNVHPPSR